MVRTDNRRAGYEAGRHLWSLGHRRFVYLTGLSSWHDFHDRGEGLRAFLEQAGAPYELEVFGGLGGEADAYQRMQQAAAAGFAATAIVASTDRHALGAMAALSDAEVAVPARVSVLGFDDYVTSGYLRPALTTMQIPAAEMGRRAVGLLAERLAGRAVSDETLLAATLVARASTGRAP